jgi:hypothetical protein
MEGRFGLCWRWITVCGTAYVATMAVRYAVQFDAPRAVGAGLAAPLWAWVSASSWGRVPKRFAPALLTIAMLSAVAWLLLPHLGVRIVDPL